MEDLKLRVISLAPLTEITFTPDDGVPRKAIFEETDAGCLSGELDRPAAEFLARISGFEIYEEGRATPGKPESKDELEKKSRAELMTVARKMAIKTSRSDTKATLIAKIRVAVDKARAAVGAEG